MIDEAKAVSWNEDRTALHKLIEELSPEIAGLYRQGVLAIISTPELGDERARLAVVGHCFRELMHNLPNVLDDVPQFNTSRRSEEDAAKRAIVELYDELYGIPEEPPVAAGDHDPDQLELVTIQRRLLVAVETMAVFSRIGKRHLLERDSAVVVGRIDPNDPKAPGLKPWRAARRFFMRCTHYDRQYEPEAQAAKILPTEDEVVRHLDTVEAILRTRLRTRHQQFFGSLREIDDLVVDANATTEEDGAP